jgi:hypothetical protein
MRLHTVVSKFNVCATISADTATELLAILGLERVHRLRTHGYEFFSSFTCTKLATCFNLCSTRQRSNEERDHQNSVPNTIKAMIAAILQEAIRQQSRTSTRDAVRRNLPRSNKAEPSEKEKISEGGCLATVPFKLLASDDSFNVLKRFVGCAPRLAQRLAYLDPLVQVLHFTCWYQYIRELHPGNHLLLSQADETKQRRVNAEKSQRPRRLKDDEVSMDRTCCDATCYDVLRLSPLFLGTNPRRPKI